MFVFSLLLFLDASLAGKKGSTWTAARFTLTIVSSPCCAHGCDRVQEGEGDINVMVKLCHFTPCLGSQVLCGENDTRESVPLYGTVPSPQGCFTVALQAFAQLDLVTY